MAINDNNSAQFADNIIENTLDAQRNLAEQNPNQYLEGEVVFNPATFYFGNTTQMVGQELVRRKFQTTPDRKHLVVGPVKFIKKFTAIPRVTFGLYSPPPQQAEARYGSFVGSSQASDYVPFLVYEYVYNFVWTNGQVDGMYVGLYALTAPPAGITSITVWWKAAGPSSRYNQQGQEESWTESYDQNEPAFLEAGEGYSDSEVEGEIYEQPAEGDDIWA